MPLHEEYFVPSDEATPPCKTKSAGPARRADWPIVNSETLMSLALPQPRRYQLGSWHQRGTVAH